MSKDALPKPSSELAVAEFLRQAALAPRMETQGRLIFALDATASRQPTWDRACQLQADMFLETTKLGGLAVQLVWYRGFGEFGASDWLTQTDRLVRQMTAVYCLGGATQIARVLAHALTETRRRRINAVAFVGDCMEEDADRLCAQAGQLGLLGVPVFIFHEGHDPTAATTFRQIADLSRGAYCRFDAGSAKQLRELLSAVAVYAAGGGQALASLGQRRGGLALTLSRQLERR